MRGTSPAARTVATTTLSRRHSARCALGGAGNREAETREEDDNESTLSALAYSHIFFPKWVHILMPTFLPNPLRFFKIF